MGSVAGNGPARPEVADPVLPAAPYLTSADALGAVGAAVRAAGGALLDLAAREVHYRPRKMLVVRFDAQVSWGGADPADETIMAATTVDGPPAGTLVVEAAVPSDDDDGPQPMQIGVWRYPFDPELPGLGAAVVPRDAGPVLGVRPEDLTLTVRSFRACRRAVVRAQWPEGEAYLKVVPPAEVGALLERHRALHEAGLPVPLVRAADPTAGLVVLAPLVGLDLRAHLCDEDASLPSPAAIAQLVERLAAVPLDLDTEATPLLLAAPRHAAMLASVHRPARRRLDALLGALSPDQPGPVRPGVVHGDLHDAQVKVGPDGGVVGVLDVDGAGRGDVYDDLGRFVGHLLALAHAVPAHAGRIEAYAEACRAEFAALLEPDELDRRIAAALVGLATGPFRTQQQGWRDRVMRLLDHAASIIGRSGT